ncbi:MAG: T9SS type A sorting domain-containing protein [Flavobacteriales bacterium]|nr:T9SS type A sorting domain-containing protein [Flavobacteriales bacterium]MBK9600014.1 T9SS type A sorting domain-containing protein [Flavobacteriales bacterium]
MYIKNYYGEDTLIDGFTYKSILEESVIYTGGCCEAPMDLGAGFLRDDTTAHKVYWRQLGMASDTLLYDFTLELGDTLKGLYGGLGLCGGMTLTVESVDSIQIGGNYRKKINFLTDDPCHETSIIEGIGSTNGLTACYTVPASYGIGLSCFSVNENIIYTGLCGGPYLAPCGELPTALGGATEIRKGIFHISPNPFVNHVEFSINSVNLPLEVSVVDLLGRELLRFPVSYAKKKLDMSSLSKGLYFLRVHKDGKFLYQTKILKQ